VLHCQGGVQLRLLRFVSRCPSPRLQPELVRSKRKEQWALREFADGPNHAALLRKPAQLTLQLRLTRRLRLLGLVRIFRRNFT